MKTIKNSIILEGTKIPHFSYVGDSVIGRNCNFGAGTKVANLRHDGKNVFINNRLVARTKPRTRKGAALTKGPVGIIPGGCYYVGTSHKHGFDSRYGEIGFICAPRIIGTGRAIL